MDNDELRWYELALALSFVCACGALMLVLWVYWGF